MSYSAELSAGRLNHAYRPGDRVRVRRGAIVVPGTIVRQLSPGSYRVRVGTGRAAFPLDCRAIELTKTIETDRKS